ncbi:MAG: PAS domain S-box protein [Candidatus Poribacteria bacterium]
MSDASDDHARLSAEVAALRNRVRELEASPDDEPLRALQRERDRAQRYLDVAGVMLIGLDTAGRVTLANRRACDILGRSHEDVVGRPWVDTFVPEHAREAIGAGILEIARGDVDYSEKRPGPVVTASGEIRSVLWQNAQVHDDDGAYIGSLSSGLDVTEHRSASDALRQSQDTMQAILAAMPDLVLHQDAEGRYLNCYKAPDISTLVPVDEFIGRRMEEVLPESIAAPGRAMIAEVLRTGDVASAEYDLDTADGQRWYDLRMARVGRDEVVSVIRDVTETRHSARRLEASERRFRALFDEAPLDLLVTTGQTTLVTANRAMEELLGYDPGEMDGLSVSAVTHADDVDATLELVARLRDGSSHAGRIEKRYLRKDGSAVHANVHAVAHRDSSDTLTQLFAFVEDVTERRRTDALLAARARQQATLTQFTQEALAGGEVSGLLQHACEMLADTLGVDYAKVLVLAAGGERLLLKAGVGWGPDLVGSAEVSATPSSQAGYTLSVAEPVVVPNVWEDKRFQAPLLLVDEVVVSGISVTIQGADEGGAPYGVLGVNTRERREFSADDAEFLSAFAAALTNVVVRARREEDIEELNAKLEARVLERTRDLDAANKRLQWELEQREQAEATLKRTQSDRSQLMQRILTIQEDEHAHIARELHDRAGQGLSSLLVGLRLLSRNAASIELSDQLEELRNVTSDTLESIRNLAFEMRPASLDHLGLAVTLEHDVRRLGTQMQIGVDFQAGSAEREPLPKDLEIAIYRAVHAALTNAAQHADPTNVSVTMQRRGRVLSIIVEDDGKGFDVEAVSAGPVDKRFGLSAMEERVRPFGGRVAYESSPGAGTTVFIELPMTGSPAPTSD